VSEEITHLLLDLTKCSTFFRKLELHDSTQALGMIDPEKEKDFFQLWRKFCFEEMYPFLVQVTSQLEQPFQKVLPAYRAVKDLPDIQPWEKFLGNNISLFRKA